MPAPDPKTETKHDRFLRLMQRRLETALEKLRLVGQLSSENYENTAQEAEEVISHLDHAVTSLAAMFAVPYSTAIGAAAQRAARTGHLVTSSHSTGKISELEIVKAMELIRADRPHDAHEVLRALLIQEKR